MFAATVTLLAIYLLAVLFYTGSICMCLARHLSGSSRAHRLWHWLERLSILGQLSYLVLRCCAVKIPHLTLCCICRPTKCSYCSSTGHCLPHECRVSPRRPCPPMMIETRCFNIIIWDRITAVGHIGQEVIVLGIVAPSPPPAEWREDNRICLLYTSPSPRDLRASRMPSSA